ncbi:olfactory receptor 52K1-like [Protopterus annectens]|uniref:olfactory receptor 52K1-like n=1 Tax=Protopterus annectens TaxID=7888 RepID=UPI001CFA8313|nr:olfactory receptor 52K1-like [Protopterus annectens]
MTETNQCSTQDLEFILTGFAGLHNIQHWLSIPFFLMFLVSLLGNLMVLFIITTEQSLHEPMYYFITVLSTVDLFIAITLLPQLLAVLSFGSQTLSANACMVHIFCLYFAVVMESSVLALMAFDRYIAVCNPLRYSSIITSTFILWGVLAVALRAFCLILPLPLLLKSLPYHNKNIINNVYFEYIAVFSESCTVSSWKDIYLYLIFSLAVVPDTIIIFFSYYMIGSVTLKLRTKEARMKAFSTFSSHAIVLTCFYITGPLSLVLSLVNNDMPAYLRALFSVLYISVPPTLNPLIYGIKTKEIFRLILKDLKKCKIVWFNK